MTGRDEFSEKAKEFLSKSVGTLCSNPQCSTPTFGPSIGSGYINIGVAAHITAASEGGQRFNPSLLPSERRSVDNGIWLCQSCAKLIDSDPNKYTIELLKRWKSLAEQRAAKALENPRIVNFGPDFADTLLVVVVQQDTFYPKATHLAPGKIARRPIWFEAIHANRTLIDTQMPIILGEPKVIPKGTSLITLSCQNQGSGVEEYIKMSISFKDAKSAILETKVMSARVQLSQGGGKGSSLATFLIRELLPGEVMAARVLVKSSLDFKASLWTQRTGDSQEVFIYNLRFGKEEHVDIPNWK